LGLPLDGVFLQIGIELMDYGTQSIISREQRKIEIVSLTELTTLSQRAFFVSLNTFDAGHRF
jgi:hypothetical protein